MYECPVCQSALEEVVILMTDCCGAEVSDEDDVCPACGAEDPLVVEAEPQFRCENCGHRE